MRRLMFRGDATGSPHFEDADCASALCRPLVVIDPEDREQVERLDRAADKALNESPKYTSTTECMQIALRSLLPSTKPDEPTGLGAVVEDAEGEKWVLRWLGASDPWVAARASSRRRYCEIAAVKVLSEGVS